MIPDCPTILAGHQFVAVRRGFPPASPRAVTAALDAARALAASEFDEPAAVFFAFAKYPRCFPHAWRFMTALLTTNQLRAARMQLRASADEFDALMARVVHGATMFDEVRQ